MSVPYVFGVASEATHMGVGGLGRSHASLYAEGFGARGVAPHAISQKARDPEPRTDTLRGESVEGEGMRTSVATGA